jgi:hypothetical protein
MTPYPFNKHRVQVNPDRCPAPFCGCDMRRHRPWLTAVVFEEDMRMSFTEAAAVPSWDLRGVHLVTCDREACRVWARLRADDLRSSQHIEYGRHFVRARPQPEPPEDMQRERLRRNLDESIDRIQARLRLRPVT